MSSVLPLQSSSLLLQTSFDFAVEPTQLRAPATHCEAPSAQRVPPPEFMQSARLPVEQQALLSHGSVSPLSTVPSQSSSTPLHTSAVGPTAPEHTMVPLVQAVRPFMHTPVPGVPVRNG